MKIMNFHYQQSLLPLPHLMHLIFNEMDTLSCVFNKYLLGLDILARPLGVLHLYTYTTPVLHLLTPINFLVWVENITCFFT